MSDGLRNLKVVVGITSRSWGGNEKWASEAARGLSALGHDTLAFYSYEPVGRELSARGVRARKIRLWGDVNPAGFTSLVRLLRELRPDVLILTKQREYWMGGLAARMAGRPLVVLRQGLRRPIREDYKGRVAFGRMADLVVVNSEDVREVVASPEWLDGSKVRVLLNGVEMSAPDVERGRRALTELGVPEGARVLVSAGRLTRQKGFDLLIRAFVPVVKEAPGVRLLILGEGGQRGALEAEALESGVADAVVFAGHRTDVRDLVAASDVYVLSSRNEGMANTLLEAMSVGAPIVATDVSGSAEAVRDGVDGLIVPSEDGRALSAAVLRLLGDPDLAARLGGSAREQAELRFSYDRMASEFESMLIEAIEARRGQPGADVV
ncbi:MAG TPA: glycosyltransferase [bacterium]|nr:glycosyltransferase [bacterium]